MQQESGILENETADGYSSPRDLSEQVAGSRIHAAAAGQTTVLAYHELSPDERGYLYGISSGNFEKHLRLAAELQQSDERRTPNLVLSFDDGHISNYVSALPLLEKHGCKAIFFVIAGRIGRQADFMTWTHLREIVSLGHRVEAHGWSHAFLTDCSGCQLTLELQQSKQVIEDRLGVPVEALSAPHGRWNHRVASECVEAGYRRLYTSNPWMPHRREPGLDVIGRLMVRRSMDDIRLRNWLDMSPTQAIVGRTRYGLKQSAKQVLGDRLYHRLWTWLSGWKGSDDTY
jgi:peptidoglycan/xylan/chitin deacetylase (PgdA/CDA1 family)